MLQCEYVREGWFRRILNSSQKLFITIFLLCISISCYGKELSKNDCAECHAEIDTISGALDKSVHGGLSCTDCHRDIKEIPHQYDLKKVNCGDCHTEEQNIYQYHGVYKVGSASAVDIPGCVDCHGNHDILSSTDKDSATNPINLPRTCSKCHENSAITDKHNLLPKKPVESYLASIHARVSTDGVHVAAVCNDCHFTGGSAHRILPPGNPESAINHFQIPNTCGKCHAEIAREYWEGIHGQLVIRGKTGSPVCTSCHGEHNIQSHLDVRSSVSSSRLAEATCAPCHESATLTEKYGLPLGSRVSFIDAYHGLKSKAGDSHVANCSSCHGAHRILGKAEPSSTIHQDNRRQTCARCHTGISKALASTPIHDFGNADKQGWLYIFTVVYIILISGTVCGMLIYILLDFGKQFRNQVKGEQVVRMTSAELLQHTLLMLTFAVLVVTGFALRFPDSWWANLLFGHVGGAGVRNNLHRIGAVLMILTSLLHLIYLRTNRGIRFIQDMFPSIQDLIQAWQMVTYNLGFTKDRPQFGRFNYGEKFEYWALVWGTIVMVITGLMLWFDNILIKYLPKVVLDVAQVIHYYEAWLATLAILIWHLYSTIFNPHIYPGNPSWLTGKMPKEQYHHEHPREKEMLEK